MKITSVKISNFRKFAKPISFVLNEEMLFVGKNNCGKTSVSEIFSKFITCKSRFLFEDFNFKCFSSEKINKIYDIYLELKDDKDVLPCFFNCCSRYFSEISLDMSLYIEENDDFSIIKPLFYEFDNNEKIVILCKYEIESIKKLLISYDKYLLEIDQINKTRNGDSIIQPVQLFEYFFRNFETFYQINHYSTKENCIEKHKLDANTISNIFHVETVNARRDVDDTSDQKSQNISMALWDYYTNIKNDNLHKEDNFRTAIESIKSNLDENYKVIFSDFLDDITENILISEDIMGAIVSSDFDIESVLQKNSKLKYILGDTILRESCNGLGLSNLIYIFIKVKLFLLDVKRKNTLINILFIEEPESHLHPQIQSTFFEKIKGVLNNDSNVIKIISTHSSYVLASSDIESIRYFCVNDTCVKVKSLSKFVEANKNFSSFIKKYFKISNCDLFFADKAVFIEGSAERLLFPTFINKVDKFTDKGDLSRQHLSIIEVGGRYANIFFDLIDFLELKSLIITDVDSILNKEKCKCDITNESKTNKNLKTSNPIIKEWFFKSEIAYIFDLINFNEEKFIKTQENANEMMLSIQKPINQETYWGRTLEEQLIIENLDFFVDDAQNCIVCKDYICKYDSFNVALKKVMLDEYEDSMKDKNKIRQSIIEYVYELVNHLNKTDFALDLIASDDDWNVPKYIKDGLLWLAK